MPLERERSRMEAPSYPFSQKTWVAWVRILAKRRSKRVAVSFRGRTRALADGEVAIVRTFVLIIQHYRGGHKRLCVPSGLLWRFPFSQRNSLYLVATEMLHCAPNADNHFNGGK